MHMRFDGHCAAMLPRNTLFTIRSPLRSSTIEPRHARAAGERPEALNLPDVSIYGV